MAQAQFRIDQATAIKLKSDVIDFSNSAGTFVTIIQPASGKTIVVDSLYVRSEETGGATSEVQVEIEIFASGGAQPGSRPVFVALLENDEVCLAASKSTPIIIDYGQTLRMTAKRKRTTVSHTANARVFINYTEYTV